MAKVKVREIKWAAKMTMRSAITISAADGAKDLSSADLASLRSATGGRDAPTGPAQRGGK
jgi:hypothetical protein